MTMAQKQHGEHLFIFQLGSSSVLCLTSPRKKTAREGSQVKKGGKKKKKKKKTRGKFIKTRTEGR